MKRQIRHTKSDQTMNRWTKLCSACCSPFWKRCRICEIEIACCQSNAYQHKSGKKFVHSFFFLKEIGKRNANVRPPRNTRKWVTLLKYLKKPPLLNFDNDLRLVNYFKKCQIIVILISSFGILYED